MHRAGVNETNITSPAEFTHYQSGPCKTPMPLQQEALRVNCSRQRDLLRLSISDTEHNSAGVPHIILVLLGPVHVDLVPQSPLPLSTTLRCPSTLTTDWVITPHPLELQKQATHQHQPQLTNVDPGFGRTAPWTQAQWVFSLEIQELYHTDSDTQLPKFTFRTTTTTE